MQSCPTSPTRFPFAETRTKLIWSLSGHSLEEGRHADLARKMADFGLDAARVTWSRAAAPRLKRLRNALTAEMESRGGSSAAEGSVPFVVTLVGRRAVLFVPGGQASIEAGQALEILARTDADACLGSASAALEGPAQICVTAADMLEGLREGSTLVVSYGQTELSVEALKQTSKGLLLTTRAIDAATLLSGMDVHSTDIRRAAFPLTDEDTAALEAGFDQLADYVVVSGLDSPEELLKLKRLVVGEDSRSSKRHPTVSIKDSIRNRSAAITPRLLLKVDSRAALDLLPKVFDELDGILLSRSELGLTVPAHDLPLIQKKLIAECNHRGKVVTVASELMYSMRTNPNPTRAEVSDMANAAADGADALFLAEEVTEGAHPWLVAEVSKETLANSEHLHEANWHRVPFEIANDDDAVAYGALQVAEHSNVKAIVCLTEGGYTALRLSSLRTPVEIIAITYNHHVMRQLSLLRSVKVLTLDRAPAFDQVLEETKKLLTRFCEFQRGDRFVFVSLTASPIGARNSNIFTVQEID